MLHERYKVIPGILTANLPQSSEGNRVLKV